MLGALTLPDGADAPAMQLLSAVGSAGDAAAPPPPAPLPDELAAFGPLLSSMLCLVDPALAEARKSYSAKLDEVIDGGSFGEESGAGLDRCARASVSRAGASPRASPRPLPPPPLTTPAVSGSRR